MVFIAVSSVETLKWRASTREKEGITLGVENHEGITQNADVCIELAPRINSPYLGINPDVTNFLATSRADAYAQIEATLPDATHAHIRDAFENGEAVDFNRVGPLFACANYKVFMSAEYEGEEGPLTGVPKLVEKIKTLWRKYSSVWL